MFNWQTGCWQAENPQPTPLRRITLASEWASLRLLADRMINDPAGVYGDLLPCMQQSDLNIVTIECALGSAGQSIAKGGPNLRGDARALPSLLAAPFHVALLANNHVADYGAEGLAETIRLLQDAGLKTVGAGLTWEDAARPLLLDMDNWQLAIINCAEGEENRSEEGGPGVYGLDVPLVEKQIAQLRAAGYVVLVVFHGGREHVPVPPPYVVKDLRRLAAAGCAAVVAHHPHVPQGLEFRNGVPIIYSQGNFLFWSNNKRLFNHVGYLVHLTFAGDRLVGLHITPYFIKEHGIEVMPGAQKQDFLHDLETVSAVLADSQRIQAVWDAVGDSYGLDKIVGVLTRSARMVLGEEQTQGAAAIKNLFYTAAHRELYINAMRRVVAQEFGTSPAWARQLVDRWMTTMMPE